MKTSTLFASLISCAIACEQYHGRFHLSRDDMLTKAAAPVVRQAPCFIVGNEELPPSTLDAANNLAAIATCNPGLSTLSGVPDISIGATSFSNIDFSQSPLTPLEFALQTFSGASPLADTDLQIMEDQLNVYTATEVGIRSVGGDLAIKVPKFFLEFQVSRVRTAQGDAPTEPGLQVDHLLGKVLNNAAGEDPALLDQVRDMAANIF